MSLLHLCITHATQILFLVCFLLVCGVPSLHCVLNYYVQIEPRRARTPALLPAEVLSFFLIMGNYFYRMFLIFDQLYIQSCVTCLLVCTMISEQVYNTWHSSGCISHWRQPIAPSGSPVATLCNYIFLRQFYIAR